MRYSTNRLRRCVAAPADRGVARVPSALDPAIKDALAARLRFYRDLGLVELYRRPVDPELLVALSQATSRVPQSLP